jgi:hypothetical protein
MKDAALLLAIMHLMQVDGCLPEKLRLSKIACPVTLSPGREIPLTPQQARLMMSGLVTGFCPN